MPLGAGLAGRGYGHENTPVFLMLKKRENRQKLEKNTKQTQKQLACHGVASYVA